MELENMTATEKKAITVMQLSGFTFYGDAMFRTFTQAKRCLDGLVRKGLAENVCGEFKLTIAGKEYS